MESTRESIGCPKRKGEIAVGTALKGKMKVNPLTPVEMIYMRSSTLLTVPEIGKPGSI